MTMTDNDLATSESNTTSGRAKAKRRTFTAEYKLAIVEEADGCTQPGEIGALLRREALYQSHLNEWRKARRSGALASLETKKRQHADDADLKTVRRENDRLKRENARLTDEVAKFKALSELAGKAVALFETLSESATSTTTQTA